MASFIRKLVSFLRSPQGRRLTQQAQRMARDPRNQHRLRMLLARLRKRR